MTVIRHRTGIYRGRGQRREASVGKKKKMQGSFKLVIIPMAIALALSPS